jgi:hypothetical protein
MTDAKAAWVARVLGVEIGALAPASITPSDLKARQSELAALIPQFAAAAAGNPDLFASLRQTAAQVGATLKLGLAMNAAEAGRVVAGIAELKALLPAAPRSDASGPAASGPGASGPAAPGSDGLPNLLEIWRDAKESVDVGITKLQASMRKHPLAALGRIADAGLNGITDKAGVGMMTAVTEADRGGNPAATKKAIAAYRVFLSTDTAAALDENPFKIDIGLRKTLGAALDSIEQRLGA